MGYIGKGLKKRLPADLWTGGGQAFVGAHTSDNWDALIKTMEVFRRIVIEVSDQLGFAYPHELRQGVQAYVEHIKTLENKKSGGN